MCPERRVIRLVPSFAEITAAGGLEAYCRQHGIDVTQPYTQLIGNGFAWIEQPLEESPEPTADETEVATIQVLQDTMTVTSLPEEAAQALAALVAARAAAGDPVLKTEAEVFLCQEQALKRQEARQVITAQRERLWRMVPSPSGRGKGHAQALWPADPSPPRLTADGMEAAPDNGSRGALSAALGGSERQTNESCRCGGFRWFLGPDGWELCRSHPARQW